MLKLSFSSTAFKPEESVVDYLEFVLSLCKLHKPFSSPRCTANTHFIKTYAKTHKHKAVNIVLSAEQLKTFANCVV